MTTYTATVESQYADAARRRRDLTDDEIAAEYVRRPSDEELATRRSRDTFTRGMHLRNAARDAVDRCFNQAIEENQFVDLDGVVILVAVHDLVATATLTLPGADAEVRLAEDIGADA